MSTTLHLRTQRGQPYGSVRLCCERCGVLIGLGAKYAGPTAVTDDESIYEAPPDGFVPCDAKPTD